MTTDTTPLQRCLDGDISTGKFAELIGVPRHVGDMILHTAFQLREDARLYKDKLEKLEIELSTPYKFDGY